MTPAHAPAVSLLTWRLALGCISPTRNRATEKSETRSQSHSKWVSELGLELISVSL